MNHDGQTGKDPTLSTPRRSLDDPTIVQGTVPSNPEVKSAEKVGAFTISLQPFVLICMLSEPANVMQPPYLFLVLSRYMVFVHFFLAFPGRAREESDVMQRQ